MSMQQWNVRVVRDGEAVHIGKVGESTEALARCAALSRFGLSEDAVVIAYGMLAAGWAMMMTAIFMRTRHHKRRLAEGL